MFAGGCKKVVLCLFQWMPRRASPTGGEITEVLQGHKQGKLIDAISLDCFKGTHVTSG